MSGNRTRAGHAFSGWRVCAARPVLVLALAGVACSTAKPRQQVSIPATPQAAQAQRDCEQGSVGACSVLGRLLTGEEATHADFERGMVLLEIACGHRDLPACVALGEIYAHHASSSVSSRARAQEMLSHACDAGAAAGCTALGRLSDRADRRDREVAGVKFRRGCELGDPEGCEALALFEERSEIQDGGKSSADEAFARACQGGRPKSCHRLALRGLHDPATRERGVQLLIDNCARGYAPSCNLAAMRYAPLLSAGPSCERAMPLAARACSAGDSLGCVLLDACQLTTPPNRAAALDRLKSACEGDQPIACLYWGDAQESDPARDEKRIRRAYGMACQRQGSPGAWLACARADASDLAHATSHIEADRAVEHLRDQCLADSAPACCVLADQYQSGKWVPADPSRTAELRQRACTLGEQRCCDQGAR